MFKNLNAITISVLFWAFCFISLPTLAQPPCQDTSSLSQYSLSPDSSLMAVSMATQPSGNSYINFMNWKTDFNSHIITTNSIILKRNVQGDVCWTKNFSHYNLDSSFVLLQTLELKDETIVGVGMVRYTAQLPYMLAQQPVLLHLAKNGNIMNLWRIDLKEDSLIQGFEKPHLTQVDADNIALVLCFSTDNHNRQFTIFKLNIASGICLWSKSFARNNDNAFSVDGLISSNNKLIVSCNFDYGGINGPSKQGFNLLMFNAADGIELNNKSYENIYFNEQIGGGTLPNYFYKIKNGNYKYIFTAYKSGENYKIAEVELDNNLKMVQTKALSLPANEFIRLNYSSNSSGELAIGYNNFFSVNKYCGFIIVDSSFNIIQQRKRQLMDVEYLNQFTYGYSNIILSDDNRVTELMNVNIGPQVVTESINASIYNNVSSCIGSIVNDITTENLAIQASYWRLDQLNDILPQLNPFSLKAVDEVIQTNEICSSVHQFQSQLPPILTKCNNDSALITANPDFATYQWQPANFSIQLNDSILKVFPPFAQKYHLTATTYSGCIVKDSVQVIVNTSPVIKFQNDTSLCSGMTITLDAGPSFTSYSWNDGSKERFKTITTSGSYIINATDSNNCISKDTFQLYNVFPTPSVNIHQQQEVCIGQTDWLSPGSFNSYLWQDGDTSNKYHVQNTGMYWVTVKNEYGCEISDTVIIKKLSAPPSDFIFSDTSFCTFQSLILKPYKSYSTYLWSTGTNQPFLEVHNPGRYSLTVTDNNGCLGTQQITISQKDCPTALYFPSAFTPNGDGKNDVFKPFLKGTLGKYTLIIYNRWGQKIFASTNPENGWDGSLNGDNQIGVFVWFCNYQFLGHQLQTQKGTFIIIR